MESKTDDGPGVYLPSLKKLRNLAGLKQSELARRATTFRGKRGKFKKGKSVELSRTTIYRAEHGYKVQLDQAHAIACVLGNTLDREVTLAELQRDPDDDAPQTNQSFLLPDWELGKREPWVRASNGLRWRVYSLFHKHLPDEMARGKLYDLRRDLPTEDLHRLKEYLIRHSTVCKMIHRNGGYHPNVARNLTTLPVEPYYWWVIDEWIEGKSLNEHLEEGPLPPERLPGVMRDILHGLQALHEAGIIRRELSPRFIYLTDDRATLTDFELAKVIDASQSVSIKDKWPDAVYRAKEVGGDSELNPNCDLLSWAVILAHAITGQQPSCHEEAASVLDARFSKRSKLKPLALACLNGKSERPHIKDLISVCKRWK